MPRSKMSLRIALVRLDGRASRAVRRHLALLESEWFINPTIMFQLLYDRDYGETMELNITPKNHSRKNLFTIRPFLVI